MSLDPKDLKSLLVSMNDVMAESVRPLNPECMLGVGQTGVRPYIDSEIGSHEGITDAELTSFLEVHASLLHRLGYYGAAHDIREAARRLAKVQP